MGEGVLVKHPIPRVREERGGVAGAGKLMRGTLVHVATRQCAKRCLLNTQSHRFAMDTPPCSTEDEGVAGGAGGFNPGGFFDEEPGHGFDAVFASVAAVLYAAEGHGCVDGAVGVNPHRSYSQGFANPEGSLNIASPNPGGETVTGIVGDLDGLGFG
jgi:hypothetical protein